jgi:hypothetical protein
MARASILWATNTHLGTKSGGGLWVDVGMKMGGETARVCGLGSWLGFSRDEGCAGWDGFMNLYSVLQGRDSAPHFSATEAVGASSRSAIRTAPGGDGVMPRYTRY